MRITQLYSVKVNFHRAFDSRPYMYFTSLFFVATFLSFLGSDIPNEFASPMHYLVPYVFLIYALGHKVELDWKKKILCANSQQC